MLWSSHCSDPPCAHLFFSPPFNILAASHEASKMSLQNKTKNPTVSRVSCHGTTKTETQTQPCFPGKALLYKLHLGFAYFCLYAAWHIWKWGAGAECRVQASRPGKVIGGRASLRGRVLCCCTDDTGDVSRTYKRISVEKPRGLNHCSV